MRRQLKLITAVRLLLLGAFVMLLLAVVAVQIYGTRERFAASSARLRSEYMAQQKSLLKTEVERVRATIEYYREHSEQRVRSMVRDRVYRACAVAEALYNRYVDQKNVAEIQQIIITALRAERYPEDNGYFFITALDGTAMLFADKPQLEGRNILQVRDSSGKYVVRDMQEIAQRKGEGWCQYLWSKPGMSGVDHKKISFIKLFKPFGWFIGTGLYVSDVEKNIQDELLDEISAIRFDKNGYIFVNTTAGDALIVAGKRYSGAKKLWQVFPDKAQRLKEIFALELKAARNPAGDYIHYTFPKPADPGTEAPKVSFIAKDDHWNWIIGAGVYLDDVEDKLALLRSELNRQLQRDIGNMLLATLLLLVVFLWLLHVVSRWLLGDFSSFVSQVNLAASDGGVIDSSKIRFRELAQMATDINIILSGRHAAECALFEEKEHLRTTLNSIGDAVITTDTDGLITGINPVAEHLTGWLESEATGCPLVEVFKIINVITSEVAENPVAQVLKNGKVVELANHTLLIARDDRRRHIADSAAPIYNANNEITGVVLVFRDVSDEYHMRKRLEASEKRYRTFFENSTDPMLIIKDGYIIDCNNAVVALLNYSSRKELINRRPGELSPQKQPDGRESEQKAQELLELALQQGQHRFEWNHIDSGGVIVPVEVSLTAIPLDGGMVLHTVWRDISARKLAMEQLKHQAHHHPLTSLPNRLLLSARLEHSIQYSRRENTRGAVLFLDLDDFKKINDSLGHGAGDKVLKVVAERLQKHGREVDTVAHISGDEFVIILQSIHCVEDAERVAEQIIKSLQEPFYIDSYELFISCSIGIVEFDGDCEGLETLLKYADAAMYQAKKNGKNSYQLYASHLTESVMEKVVLEAQLRKALEHGELRVYYQPQVDLSSGKVVALEALMRWEHPQMGLVAPNRFIPLAEETGLIVPMGEWIMRAACTQLVQWQRQGYRLERVAVNLSGRQLKLKRLPALVKRILHDTGCAAGALELEITEGFIMSHPQQSIAMLEQVRALGVELSVDDFGTGHSSLNYLKRLPINRLKIDCSFVWDIGCSSNGEELVKSIIDLGHRLDLSITAEGIENEAQQQFLVAANCDEGQGYLYSKPVPADEITAMLKRNEIQGKQP